MIRRPAGCLRIDPVEPKFGPIKLLDKDGRIRELGQATLRDTLKTDQVCTMVLPTDTGSCLRIRKGATLGRSPGARQRFSADGSAWRHEEGRLRLSKGRAKRFGFAPQASLGG